VTTIFTVMLLLAAVSGGPSTALFIIGGLRYRISNGDSKAIEAAKNTIIYSVLGSFGATVIAGTVWGLGSALVPAWTTPALILTSATLASAPFAVALVTVSCVGSVQALLVAIRRAVRLVALLMPADEREEYAEVHLALLRLVMQRRGQQWRLWPLLSNILFFSPFVALKRHRARIHLNRAVVAAGRRPGGAIRDAE
jgi:hypothetical protein